LQARPKISQLQVFHDVIRRIGRHIAVVYSYSDFSPEFLHRLDFNSESPSSRLVRFRYMNEFDSHKLACASAPRTKHYSIRTASDILELAILVVDDLSWLQLSPPFHHAKFS
jgi:hypothetical protein